MVNGTERNTIAVRAPDQDRPMVCCRRHHDALVGKIRARGYGYDLAETRAEAVMRKNDSPDILTECFTALVIQAAQLIPTKQLEGKCPVCELEQFKWCQVAVETVIRRRESAHPLPHPPTPPIPDA